MDAVPTREIQDSVLILRSLITFQSRCCHVALHIWRFLGTGRGHPRALHLSTSCFPRLEVSGYSADPILVLSCSWQMPQPGGSLPGMKHVTFTSGPSPQTCTQGPSPPFQLSCCPSSHHRLSAQTFPELPLLRQKPVTTHPFRGLFTGPHLCAAQPASRGCLTVFSIPFNQYSIPC